MTGSAFFILAAHLTTMFLPDGCPDASYMEIIPLVLIGVGFSVYAAALWPSIPYVVEARTVGTAFGVCTAMQNAGLAIGPTIGGAINEATKDIDFGYYWQAFYWSMLMVIAIFVDLALYYVDSKRGWVLNRVDKGQQISDLMTSPKPEERRKIAEDEHI